MSEIISLHIGQAGVQIAESTWELFCLEHGVHPDGRVPDCVKGNNGDGHGEEDDGVIFREAASGKRVPRAILIDTEESVVGMTFDIFT
jgi:tubulin alpha